MIREMASVSCTTTMTLSASIVTPRAALSSYSTDFDSLPPLELGVPTQGEMSYCDSVSYEVDCREEGFKCSGQTVTPGRNI